MLEQLKTILAKVNKKIDMNTVTNDTRLIEDLGLDSLSIMLFAMEIRDRTTVGSTRCHSQSLM